MALVLTLLAVSFLIAVTVQLSTSVNWQLQASSQQGKTVQLDALLLSGLNLAQAALLSDQRDNKADTLLDSWSTLKADAIANLVADGTLDIQITDLSGLLQVNAFVLSRAEKKRRAKGKKTKDKKAQQKYEKLQWELWQRFLLLDQFVPDNEDAVNELLHPLADWLDEDSQERDNGAEQPFYSGLSPAYVPANGSILFVEELLLIKGWNKNILYGDKEHSGIIDYLTIAGETGKININTAPALLLQALHPDMTEELASTLVEFRSDEKNKDRLKNINWYKQVGGFPGNISFPADLITVSSNAFRIAVTAKINNLQRSGTGVILRRDTKEQVLLYWKVQ
jgi:general secretion pathway protein K